MGPDLDWIERSQGKGRGERPQHQTRFETFKKEKGARRSSERGHHLTNLT